MDVKRIVSVSRRTDVPAFYGDWFARRLHEGFAGWENPFGGQKYLVSLLPEDVMAFVFWSKNYTPFMPVLDVVRSKGYPVMFNYTITGLPSMFETEVVPVDVAIDNLRAISALYSPDHVNWRYDPIVISRSTDTAYHVDRFTRLAGQLKGYTRRCYFSFAIRYGKVERNFAEFDRQHDVGFYELEPGARLALASQLATIAAANGMEMFTCCGDALIGGLIRKAHCVDGDILARIYPGLMSGHRRPTRKECGCTESTDIGRYDTCPHGCIYCYANVNKRQAVKLHDRHDARAAFLGLSRDESDRLVKEIGAREACARACESSQNDFQLSLGI